MKITFKNIYRLCAATVLIKFGFVDRAVKRALKGDFILCVYFHNPDKHFFRYCLQWFLSKGLHFISVKDLDLIQKGLEPFPQGAVLITVDDGWRDNERNVVEEAVNLNVPVAIFISTGPVKEGVYWWSYLEAANSSKILHADIERVKKLPNAKRLEVIDRIKTQINLKTEALTVSQLKKIAVSNMVTVGAHSVTHPILVNCTDEESSNEIRCSKSELEEWLQKEIKVFSYPNGSYGSREIEYLKSAGYSMGFNTKEEYLTKERLENTYDLPRFWVNEGASNAENLCRMVGLSSKFKFK